MFDPAIHLLGAKPTRFDECAIQLSDIFSAKDIIVKRRVAWSDYVTGPLGEMLNTTVGCCVIAARGHQEMTMSSVLDQPWRPTDLQVEALYQKLTLKENGRAYDPADPSTDTGLDPLDMMLDWKAGTSWNRPPLIGFAQGSIHNTTLAFAACDAFCGFCADVALPVTAQRQKIWDVVDKNLRGDSAPYSWGAHEIYIPDYDIDAKQWKCISWGQRVPMTIDFAEHYITRIRPVIAKVWVTAKGAPSGLNEVELEERLKQIH